MLVYPTPNLPIAIGTGTPHLRQALVPGRGNNSKTLIYTPDLHSAATNITSLRD